MPKYEIMLVLDGELSEVDSRLSLEPIISLYETLPDFEMNIVWNDTLAYPIEKKTLAHRFIFTFLLTDKLLLKRFQELSVLNKHILRTLVINVENDYGYKALNNAKKIKGSEIKQAKYKKYLQNRAAKYEKLAQQQR